MTLEQLKQELKEKEKGCGGLIDWEVCGNTQENTLVRKII